MNRTRAIKKKARVRLTLLKNLRKGQARKEQRCGFQIIPLPNKYACGSKMHHLNADLVLMEHDDTLVTEASLYNNFKTYKSAQVVSYLTQKVLKIKADNKRGDVQTVDWRPLVEKLENSESSQMRQSVNLLKTYCERYEDLMREFKQEMSSQKYQFLMDMNEKTEKTRQNIIRTYPCFEMKFQLKDGQIQLSEISFSEKYLTELGYAMDSFAASVLQEGIPEMTPINSESANLFAKLRLQKYLTTDAGGYQTPEFESTVIMKNGCLRKVKMIVHYHTCYEKGVLGFVITEAIVAKQRPFIRNVNQLDEIKLEQNFVEMMARREKEKNEFLSVYYNQTLEQKYTNRDKVCKIKEIKDQKDR